MTSCVVVLSFVLTNLPHWLPEPLRYRLQALGLGEVYPFLVRGFRWLRSQFHPQRLRREGGSDSAAAVHEVAERMREVPTEAFVPVQGLGELRCATAMRAKGEEERDRTH